MPTFDFYMVDHTAHSYFSFEINREGIFLFICPLQLALLWPWIKV
jgi:hypothetical protein